MKRLMFVFLLLAIGVPAFAGETQLQKSTNVLNEVMRAPDQGIPNGFSPENAVCVGMHPRSLKFAFGFGGELWTGCAGMPPGRQRCVGRAFDVHSGRRELWISDRRQGYRRRFPRDES